MADKIVQLQDEDGNNIFPLCRGLGNGTVTDASIDWSTMGGTDYISQCTASNFSLDASSYLIKYPNGLVIFYLQGVNTSQFGTGGTNFLEIPFNDFLFRGSGNYVFFAGSNPWIPAACNFSLYSDRANSKLYFRAYPLANRAANTRFDVAGCYFTQ